MNVNQVFNIKSLKLKLFTCVLSGAALGQSVFAQDAPVQAEASPDWRIPTASATAKPKAAPKITASPRGLFERPQVQTKVLAAPTGQPLKVQRSNVTAIKVTNSLQAPTAKKRIGASKLTEPLPIHASRTAGKSIPGIKKSRVIKDRFVIPTGNDEPGLLDPNLPASQSFPEDAPRMTAPGSSVFSNSPAASLPQQTDPAAFPNDSVEIPPLGTSQSVGIPDVSQPAPFGASVEMPQTTNRPAPAEFAPTEQPFPPVSSQTTYDPPASKPAPVQTPRLTQSQAPVEEDVHEVQPGENYWTISRQHFGTARYFAALAEYNKHRIPRPDRMKPGMFVLVPTTEALEQRYPKIAGIIDAQPSPESLLASGYFIGDNQQPFYRIGKGDTLSQIAEDHLGRTARWTQIVGMNRELLRDGNTLKIGMVLRLPRDASQISLAPPVE